jgi:hypothetical protein
MAVNRIVSLSIDKLMSSFMEEGDGKVFMVMGM